MPPTRETTETLQEKYGDDLPSHIQIVGVTFDEDRGQSLVTVACEKHESQEPVPLGYLRKTKYYCVECGNDAKGQTTGDSRYTPSALEKMRSSRLSRWIAKSQNKFGDRFDYSEVEKGFRTARDPVVRVACREHQKTFTVLPDKHHQNQNGGCPDCEKESRFETRILRRKHVFEEWFEENHGDRLEITSTFRGMTNELEVHCKIHQTDRVIVPSVMMLQGRMGCDACASEVISNARKLSREDVERQYADQLPPGISIEDVRFNEDTRRTETALSCEIHGSQKPVPLSYLRSTPTFCVECGYVLRGFPEDLITNYLKDGSRGRESELGVVELEVFGIRAMKVGITTRSLEHRYGDHLREIFYRGDLSELDALVIENRVKLEFFRERDDRILKAGMREGKRWGGDTEFYFSRNKDPIISFIRDLEIELENGSMDYEFEKSRVVVPSSYSENNA